MTRLRHLWLDLLDFGTRTRWRIHTALHGDETTT